MKRTVALVGVIAIVAAILVVRSLQSGPIEELVAGDGSSPCPFVASQNPRPAHHQQTDMLGGVNVCGTPPRFSETPQAERRVDHPPFLPIAGFVLESDGTGIWQSLVLCQLDWLPRAHGVRTASTDENGAFEFRIDFEAISEKHLSDTSRGFSGRLVAFHPKDRGRFAEASFSVPAAEAGQGATVRLTIASAGGGIAANVEGTVTSQGIPLPSCTAEFRSTGGEFTLTSVTNDHGQFELRLPRGFDYTGLVHSPNGSPFYFFGPDTRVDHVADQKQAISVDLPCVRGVIRGVVTTSGEVEGPVLASIELVNWSYPICVAPEKLTSKLDARGSFVFSGLPLPASYVVRIHGEGVPETTRRAALSEDMSEVSILLALGDGGNLSIALPDLSKTDPAWFKMDRGDRLHLDIRREGSPEVDARQVPLGRVGKDEALGKELALGVMQRGWFTVQLVLTRTIFRRYWLHFVLAQGRVFVESGATKLELPLAPTVDLCPDEPYVSENRGSLCELPLALGSHLTGEQSEIVRYLDCQESSLATLRWIGPVWREYFRQKWVESGLIDKYDRYFQARLEGRR